jgi:3-oxoacyl-[acyl-carrier protein] reductase
VELFLENGATVDYLSRSEGDILSDLRERGYGKSVAHHPVDIADERSVGDAIEAIIADRGGVDILVNNAGVTRDGLIMRMSVEDWESVLRVNLTGAFLAARAVTRTMIKQRDGSIINVSSIVGLIGNGGQANYAASKAGLIGFTKSLARETAGRSVRVNAIAPGFIDTEMTEKLNDTQRETLTSQIPVGRIGTADEVARVCLFLASDMSSYITGEVISVTGGLGM